MLKLLINPDTHLKRKRNNLKKKKKKNEKKYNTGVWRYTRS